MAGHPVTNSPPLPDNEAHSIAISSKERSEAEVLEIQSSLYELFSAAFVEIGSVHQQEAAD